MLWIPCTCVLLRPHWPIDDPLEGCYPIPLLCLGLAGEQELPVGSDDGDAVVPVAALGGRGQAGQDGVAVLLTADEHLAAGVGILREGGKAVIGQDQPKDGEADLFLPEGL